MPSEKVCQVYQYTRAVESYIGKEGKPTECARTSSMDHGKPAHKLVAQLSQASKKTLNTGHTLIIVILHSH